MKKFVKLLAGGHSWRDTLYVMFKLFKPKEDEAVDEELAALIRSRLAEVIDLREQHKKSPSAIPLTEELFATELRRANRT